MNFFLVGNGFDLHHKFPTGYLNFLNTVKFLTEKYDESFTTVGKVFGNQELQEKDIFIKECYEKHCGVYNSTVLPKDKIKAMITRVEHNMWFKYLCNSVTKDIKWIDFEKEIIRVLDAFAEFFDYDDSFVLIDDRITFNFSEIPERAEYRHILSQFNFFFEKSKNNWVGNVNMMCVKPQYATENVVGSNTYHIAIDDIASFLYISLQEFSTVLRDYLLLFVDGPAKEFVKLNIVPRFEGIPTASHIYSFNYTNTFEILHNSTVDHIHGNTNTDIVLGINPNQSDNIGSIDTTFLQFKKYFQRVFFKSDMGFLRNIKHFRQIQSIKNTTLYVIGHSLDATDEDIIKQIFESVGSIIILYHSQMSVKNQIKNLVEIYGKEGLDKLRAEQHLQFLPQGEIQWCTLENN